MIKKRNKSPLGASWVALAPVIFFMCVVPFIVRYKLVLFDMSQYTWYTNTRAFADLFSYYKAVAIIGAAIVMLFMYGFKKTQRSNKQPIIGMNHQMFKAYIPLLIYWIFMVLSWITSDSLAGSTTGYADRFEGGVVLTSYLIAFFYMTKTIECERDIKRIFVSLVVSTVLLNVIGIFQFFKMDYINSEFFKRLIAGSLASKARFNNSTQPGRVYMTMFHPNFVGLYLAMILPITTSLFITSKKWWHKFCWLLLSVMVFVNLLGSQSRGGLVGVSIAALLGLILMGKKVLKIWFIILPSLLIMIGVFFYADQTRGQFFSTRIKETLEETFGKQREYALNGMVTKEKSLRMDYNGTDFVYRYKDPNKWHNTVIEIDGKPIDFKVEAGKYIIDHPAYKKAKIQYVVIEKLGPHLSLNLEDVPVKQWYFHLGKEEMKYRNSYNKLVQLEEVPAWGFKGREHLGSKRGYIWSRTLPMLGDNFFVGVGPDQYIFHFPNTDYVGIANAYSRTNIVVDKPHNLFLQTAINSGVLSLLCMLVFWGVYFVDSFKLYLKESFNHSITKVGVALFLGICGYLGAGLFNDTLVSVSPIYWGIIGLGYSTNALVRVRQQENQQDNKSVSRQRSTKTSASI